MKKDFRKALKYLPSILDAWLPWKIRYDEVPGMSVGVVYQGKLMYASGFGFANLDRKQKTTERTCYRIASISKVFTAVSIMQLVEAGRIRLDDPVTKYLPWFKIKTKLANAATVSVRQILSHSAGLFRDGNDPHWATGDFPSIEMIRSQITRETFSHENLTRFKYSNFGFALLGAVIVKASGKSYEHYLAEHIFKPLQMRETFADFVPRAAKRLAQGYGMKFPGKTREPSVPTPTHGYAAAAGLISNIQDLAKFISALCHHAERTVISRESLKEMTRTQWKVDDQDTGAKEYGLGVMITKMAEQKVLCHSGGFMGFETNVVWDQEKEFGVIVLINSNDSNVLGIARGIMEMIYYLVDHVEDFAGTANLKKYAGTYRSRWGDEVVVPVGRKLVAFAPSWNLPAKSWMILKPVGKDIFKMDGPNMFDHIGEKARFDFKNGKAATLYWGPMPHQRIL